MQYRKEILRGVRLAAVAFTALLLVLISYRIMHGVPAEASPKAAAPAVQPEAPVKPPVVHATSAEFDVPVPPPSQGSRPARVHKAPAVPIRQAAAPLLSARILNGEPEPAPQTAAGAPVNEITASPVTLPVQATPEVASAMPEAAQDNAPTPTNRKRGVLRSVGHFLHIGKRDTVQPNTLNQP